MTSLPTTPCRGCGRPLVWAETADKRIPCDPRPPVYRVEQLLGGRITATRAVEHMVTHFATCSMANKFTKRGVEPSAQDEIDALRSDLQKARDQLSVATGRVADVAPFRGALENVRMYVAVNRRALRDEDVQYLLRFCADAGVTGSVLREEPRP